MTKLVVDYFQPIIRKKKKELRVKKPKKKGRQRQKQSKRQKRKLLLSKISWTISTTF